MSKTKKNSGFRGPKIKGRRIFSESFKRSKVKDIENGLYKISELASLYDVSASAIYKWLYKYSVHYQRSSLQVVQMESEAHKSQILLSRVKELEAALGRKQLELEYLENLIKLASSELNLDLKKNFDTKSSPTSKRSEKKGDTK